MNEIGRFSITTFSGESYTFIVDEDYMYCHELVDYPIKRLFIKPNIELIGNDKRFSFNEYARENKTEKKFVKEYNIDEELLDYMIKNRRAYISTEMAIYYGFNKAYGYDLIDKTNCFKWAKKKGLILTKQKEGNFN